MSNETVDLRVDAEDISLGLLARSLLDLSEIVSDVAANLLGRGRVSWVIEDLTRNSPALVSARPVATHRDIDPEILNSVPAAIERGLRSLQTRVHWPDYFSERALERVRSLARLSSPDVHIQVATTTLVGTVEGRLESVSLHGTSEFSLYTHLDDRRVRCFFGSRVGLPDIREGIGRRVAVYGTMKVRDDGAVSSITADELTVLPDESDLPDYRAARGLFGAM